MIWNNPWTVTARKLEKNNPNTKIQFASILLFWFSVTAETEEVKLSSSFFVFSAHEDDDDDDSSCDTDASEENEENSGTDHGGEEEDENT